MSKIRKSDLSNGVSYACAFLRLRMGWPFERAVSEPPRYRSPNGVHASLSHKPITKAPVIRQRITKAPVIRQRIRYDTQALPTSHIRRVLADYCDYFIKTGTLDASMSAQLKEYADDRRTASRDPQRVSAELAARRDSRGPDYTQDNGDRNVHQTDVTAAERIADFLRLS